MFVTVVSTSPSIFGVFVLRRVVLTWFLARWAPRASGSTRCSSRVRGTGRPNQTAYGVARRVRFTPGFEGKGDVFIWTSKARSAIAGGGWRFCLYP